MNLLLLSNSSSDAGYLTHALPWIREWASQHDRAGEALFVPFAGVTRDWDTYESMVAQALCPLGLRVRSVHRLTDPVAAVQGARHLLIGGGNSFALLRQLRSSGLLGAIGARVASGEASYLGWSAGSNVACPTICTTNDMPITDPDGFTAMGLVPLQINAHYTDTHPPGHRGETREQRLREFTTLNPEMPVLGLPEGTGLRVQGLRYALLGAAGARWFHGAQAPQWLAEGSLHPL